jgi:TonB family protein
MSDAIERDNSVETLQAWEGRTIGGKFPLQSYVGETDHSAVFVTHIQREAGDSKKAAIKLIPADSVDPEIQLQRWGAAREFKNDNLIRIFESGRSEVHGTALLYVVEEYAEENLGQILPERALTAEEVRGMLPPVLNALSDIHRNGFVHGHIRPSNILAVGDRVKLSSDTVCQPGERCGGAGDTSAYDAPEPVTADNAPASDVWQLGMTLVEVLTQHLPIWDRRKTTPPEIGAVPEPFREIAVNCLQVDPAKRWTVPQILNRLEGKQAETVAVPTRVEAQPKAIAAVSPISPQEKKSGQRPYLLTAAVIAIVVILVILVAFVLLRKPNPSEQASPVQSTQSEAAQSQAGSLPESSQPAQRTTASKTKPADAANSENNNNQGEVLQRVIPEVSAGARRTIQGKIKVRVKVEVNAAGNVTQAKFESAGPSKYFSRLAMEAARGWQFAPAGNSASRQWKLVFVFSRSTTEVSAEHAK